MDASLTTLDSPDSRLLQAWCTAIMLAEQPVSMV